MSNAEELASATGARKYRSVTEQELHAVLEYLCDPKLQPWPKPEQAQVVLGLDLSSNMRTRGLDNPYWMQRPMMKHLHAVDYGSQQRSIDHARDDFEHQNAALAKHLLAASSLAEAAEIILDGLRAKLVRVLGIDETQADPNVTMSHLGVDSVAAVEVRTWFLSVTGAEMAIFEVLGGQTIEACAWMAAMRSVHVADALKK